MVLPIELTIHPDGICSTHEYKRARGARTTARGISLCALDCLALGELKTWLLGVAFLGSQTRIPTKWRFAPQTVRLAKTSPEKLAHPEVTRSLEQALIRAMVRCLTEGTSTEPGISVRHHSAVMARLEEFLAANHDRPAYLAELCTATGAS